MFYMNTINSLQPILKNNNQQIQEIILQIFLNIIRNGWNRIKQSQLQQLSDLEENDQQQQNQPKFFINNSYSSHRSNSQQSQHSNSSQGSQLSMKLQQSFHNIPDEKYTHNIFGDLQLSSQQAQSRIQKLLLFQHPYQTILERQNMIQFLIQEILADNKYNIEIKEKICEILDILYINGFKFNDKFGTQIIEQFCQSTKSNDKNTRNHAFIALTYLSVNKKNNEEILNEDILDIISQEIKSVNKVNNSDIIRNSLIILQYLYINGSKKTKLEINKIMTFEQLEQLMNNQYYVSEAEILISTFSDPITYEQLMKIKRSINNKNEEYLDELFNAGLSTVLNEQIVNIIIKEDNKEGLLILLGQIQEMIPQDIIQTYRLTFNESDFIAQQLYILNSLDVSEIKVEQLDILLKISYQTSPNQSRRLFSKEIFRTIIRIFNSEDKDVINKANIIISNFIEYEMKDLKKGEQHPQRQQLMTNEILMDINQLLKNSIKKDIHYFIAQIIANLYKAYPLPPEMQIKVIQELKNNKDYNKLSLLAECSENKFIILENGIEKKLFEYIIRTFDYFHLTLKYVKYQSVENRMEFALYAQQEVMKLTNIQYLNEFGKRQRWFDNEKQEIQIKRQQLLIIIKENIDNNSINYFSSTQPLNHKRISTISKLIDYIIENRTISIQLFCNLFAKTLKAYGFLTQQQQYDQASDKIQIIQKEIIRKLISMINFQTIKNDEDIELIFQSGLIIELIELIKHTPIEQLTKELIESIKIICFYGSAKHTHQLFQMGIFQILSPKLKNKDKKNQLSILKIFIEVIKKRWQLLQQSESSQSHLQQLLTLSLPHPYFEQLEQQQIIITIIQEVILNDESYMENKKNACQLLDSLYSEGIKLPKNLKSQIVKLFCEQSKSNNMNIKNNALESLSIIAVNQENHDLIISEEVFENAANCIIKKSQSEIIIYNKIRYSFLLILNLFLFGSQETQQLIQNSISKETLSKIIDSDQIKYLLSAYANPDQMKQIMKIRRIIGRRNEQGLIELIKAGLLQMINEMIEKAISKEEIEEEIIAINQNILKHLIHNPHIIEEIIYELTDFFNQYLHIINSLPLNQMKEGFLSPLSQLQNALTIKQNNKIFQNGIIQSMMKILESQDKDIREEVLRIIWNVIQTGAKDLKEGQQHPFYKQFQSDGTFPKLIKIFKDEKDQYNHEYIAQTLSYLFKALPLPPEIRNNVIEKFKQKYDPDFIALSLLAECPDNHDAILSNQFEMKLFSNDYYTLECLKFSFSILKYGSNINKLKVSSVIKDEVEQLANDEYVDKLGNGWNWNSDKNQQIKSRSKELLSLIISIINDNDNINLISQQVIIIQDSKDKDHKQYLCEVILNFIKVQINGLKEGQQHPLHQQFQSDGTIAKLIEILKDEKNKDIHHQIAQILAYLFKSLPLPPEICNNVIEILKINDYPSSINFYELSLLAECPDNHEAILSNQFEMKLFKYELNILESLNISLSILKYGSNINKLKITSAIKDEVEQLTNDEYVDELGNKSWNNWNKDKIQKIKSKSKELIPIIISLINDNDNINLISQLVIKIQDSKDNNVRKDSIRIILNFIKVQINGLKEGQQHILYQQFSSDGTIPKLIQLFKDEKDEDIHEYIAQILAYLFKSLPLPPEIRNNVIEKLKFKYKPNYYELSLLSECPDNHDEILSNQFEMKLFLDNKYTIEYLDFSLSILKNGININKLKFAFAIQDKIEQLTNDIYVDELGKRLNWNEDKKLRIKMKTKEIIVLINNIDDEKKKEQKFNIQDQRIQCAVCWQSFPISLYNQHIMIHKKEKENNTLPEQWKNKEQEKEIQKSQTELSKQKSKTNESQQLISVFQQQIEITQSDHTRLITENQHLNVELSKLIPLITSPKEQTKSETQQLVPPSLNPNMLISIIPDKEHVYQEGCKIIRTNIQGVSTVAFDPIISSGIVRFGGFFENHIISNFSFGIADSSAVFGSNEDPSDGENKKKTVRYYKDGDISHIGDCIKGNSRIKENKSVAMEVNMNIIPRTLTFFYDNQEQPVSVTNIPSAIRFYICLKDANSSFTINRFQNIQYSNAKGVSNRKVFEWGKRW